jgi:hypothetical protein
MVDTSYGPKVYRKQAGNELVVASGGVLTIESGGTFNNGGTINNTGTQTFDEITGNDTSLAITGAAAADATSAGGAVAVAGAVGGATSGTGGAASVAGGAGAGTGSGGAASVVGGASGAGATGAGAAASVTGGAALSTNGNGGDVVLAGGAKAGSGKNGAIYRRGVSLKTQGVPAAKTVTAAISAAELVAGLITTTGVTGPSVHQLPTGTLIDAELPGIATGDSFDFHIINTGTGAADDATITVNTDVTIVGNPTVGSLTDATIISGSGHFRARRSAANAYVVYRLA